MTHTADAEKIVLHLLETLPRTPNSQRELRAREALYLAAQALRDYGSEKAAQQAIADRYSNR